MFGSVVPSTRYDASVARMLLGWPIDKPTVIRANRDTLYSAAVFDLDAGGTALSSA